MFNLTSILGPASLRDLFTHAAPSTDKRTLTSSPSAAPPAASKNPLTYFPSSSDLEAYPAPGSFAVQGDICNQIQSPLFSTIPPELRNQIFALALAEYVPAGNEWSRESYVRRPGYEGLKTVDAALLRTCKRVYEETKMLPLSDLEVCFYMGHKNRAPEWFTMSKYTSMNTYIHPRANWFKPEHWARIQHFHIFSQTSELSKGLRSLFRNNLDICLHTSLTITFRYTDWSAWETNTPLLPIDHFLPVDTPVPSTVEKITVEFETTELKVEELEALVDVIFQRHDTCTWTRRDGRVLRVCGGRGEGDGVRTWRWAGPTTYGVRNQKFAHHGEGGSMTYVVKAVNWELGGEGDDMV